MAEPYASTAFQRRLATLEPLAVLVLGLHGAAMLMYQGGAAALWIAVGAVALLGAMGLAGWRGTGRAVLVRLGLLLAATWLLMSATGGTGSYFLLWYFVLLPVYTLLLTPRGAAVLLAVVCLSYLSMLALPVFGVPPLVVAARVLLLLFIGWIVRAVSQAAWHEVAERRRAEQTLKAGEEHFHVALDAAAMGAWDWDVASGVISWTDNVEGIFDLPEGTFAGTYEAYLALIHPADRPYVQQKIDEALATGEEYAVEHRVLHADATVGWIGGRGRVFFDAEGRPVRMAGTLTDITAFKKAEEERGQLFARMAAARTRAEQAEQHLAQILERITDAFIALDAGWRYTYVNERAAQIFNRRREDLLGRHIWSEFPDDVDKPFYQACHRAVEAQTAIHMTEYYPPLDCWFDNYLYPSEAGLSIFFTDITEQKRAEEAVQASEEQYRGLFEAASDAIFLVELPTARILKSNGKAAELVRYTEDELRRLTVFDLDPPEDRPRIEQIVGRVMEEGSALFEHRLVCKDGAQVPVEISTRLIEYEGRPALQSFVRDITERKAAEEALRQSQERLDGILRSLDDAVWSVDVTTGRLVYMSPASKAIYGHPPADFIGQPHLWMELIHPEDRAVVQGGSASESVDGSCNLQYRVVRPDGAVRWVHDRSQLVFDEAGRAVRRDGIVTDITERKEVEGALEASEELNRRIVEALPGGIVQVSRAGEVLYANATAQRILGLSYDQLTGSYVADFETVTFWEDGSVCPVEAYPVTKCLQTGRPQPPATIGVRRPDGSMTWSVYNAVPLIDPQTRQLSGAVITFLDITERKQAEAAIRASEERFSKVFHASPIAIAVTRLEDGQILEVNKSIEHNFGYTRAQLVGRSATEIGIWSDERARERLVLQIQEQGTRRDFEIQIPTIRGEPRTMQCAVEIVQLGEDPCLLWMGVDVTERKRLEKEILDVSAREQRRIGQDLHDELGQLLAGIGFRVAELEGDLRREAARTAADAAEIGQMVVRAIEQTRALAQGLNPISVEQQGLASALRELTLRVERIYGMPCVFTYTHPVHIEDVTVATQVYRIAQESVNNALKHASASRIEVALVEQEDQVTLSVRDDGVGLPPAGDHPPGMGLRIMAYRAHMIGGSFEVGPAPGGGTLVTCHFAPVSVPQPAQ